jgi:hypothetical protein
MVVITITFCQRTQQAEAAWMFGSAATVVVASILTVALTVESRHHRRSGGQLPPGDHGHKHTAEAARSDHGDPDPSSSRPPRRWDPHGRRYAIGHASK